MIGLYDDDGTTRLSVSYNSLTLNNDADEQNDTYEINGASVAGVYTSIEDAHPEEDGSEAYGAQKTKLIVVLDGTIRAPSISKLFDKIKALRAAFDASKASYENPTSQGFLALDFSTPTTDTTNYPTGLVPSRYYVRERRLLVPPSNMYSGLSQFFRVELEAIDPRRYLQTTDHLDGAGAADNTLADFRSFPTISITMSGAGANNFRIQRAASGVTTQGLDLDLTLETTGTIVVDMATRSISKVDQDKTGLYVSGDWWSIEPASNTITISNGTNATVVTTWRRAFCA